MRKRIAHGLMAVFYVVSLGAAQGPHSSAGSGQTLGAATKSKTQVTRQAVTKPARKLSSKAYQVGTASWYGEYFEGKPTASGEPYKMHDLTAAHPTLPLGSWVKVTNLRNGRATVVRINDRGPVVPGRIIDVSYGAAQALHFKSRGLQRVRLDVVEPPQVVASLQPLAY